MGNMGMADSEYHEKMMRLGQQRDAVPARRPVDDALDRLDKNPLLFTPQEKEDLATVREALERLREERDGLRWQLDDLRRQAMEMKEQGIWPVSKVVERAEAAEAEVRRLTEGLREIAERRLDSMETWREHTLDFQRIARALLSASPSDGGGA